MDRRVFLALALSAIVVILTQLAFPTRRPVPRTAADSVRAGLLRGDKLARGAPAGAPAGTGGATTAVGAPTPAIGAADSARVAAPAAIRAETTVVRTPKVEYRLSSLGATPVSAQLLEYSALGRDGSRMPER